MANIGGLRELSLSSLKPYKRNAKKHSREQIEKIKNSIREFGFISPFLIDKDHNLIVGHGRLEACKELGITSAPCVFIEGLTDEQRRAYILADNKLADMGEWDVDLLQTEIANIDFDMSGFGFEIDTGSDWFENRTRYDDGHQEGNDEYNEFIDKFEVAKTTDDCYTPDVIYETIAEWVSETYKVDRSKFVRPFYPGGDYEHEIYPDGCIVVDNPPFSILAKIITFYGEKGIPFFLFSPSLTGLTTGQMKYATMIVANAQITYENGAIVNTSFTTNLGDTGIAVTTAPDLRQRIEDANAILRKEHFKEFPKYEYPPYIVTMASMGVFARHDVPYSVRKGECLLIEGLDAQKPYGKQIYGRGLLLNEEAKQRNEKAKEETELAKIREEQKAFEESKKVIWDLSERERELVKKLSEGVRP